MFEGLFQPMHLLIILIIALIVFGPKRLPELGAGLGKSLREFKKALSAEPEKPTIEDKPPASVKTEETVTDRQDKSDPEEKSSL